MIVRGMTVSEINGDPDQRIFPVITFSGKPRR
jgi:hypothetical protein